MDLGSENINIKYIKIPITKTSLESHYSQIEEKCGIKG